MPVTAVTTILPAKFLEHDGVTLTGPYSVLYHAINSKLNNSVNLNIVGSGDFGKVVSENNGTGIFGSLLRNESLFSVAPQPFTEEACRYLDYTSVLLYDDWAIVSGKPILSYQNYSSALAVFDFNVWLGIFVAFVTFTMFRLLLPNLLVRKRSNRFKSKRQSIVSSMLFTLRVLVRQDVNFGIWHKFLHQRILFASLMLGFYGISTPFMCCILARYSKADSLLFYDKLEDFLQYPDVKLFLFEDTQIHDEIKNSLNPMMRKLWRKVLEDGSAKQVGEITVDEIFANMLQGKIAFTAPKRIFLSLINIYCELVQENVPLFSNSRLTDSMIFTIYTRKDIDEELKRLVNFVVFQIVETKTIDALIDRDVYYGELCLQRDPPQLVPLQLIKIYIFVIFYIVAITLSILCHIIWFSLAYFKWTTV